MHWQLQFADAGAARIANMPTTIHTLHTLHTTFLTIARPCANECLPPYRDDSIATVRGTR
jgi:hypothetical protein